MKSKVLAAIFSAAAIAATVAVIPAEAGNDWTIEARGIPTGGEHWGEYYGVTLGNGGIGIMPWKTPFSIEQLFRLIGSR